MEVTPKLQEDLVCPVCFEIPTEKIFLCKNGHMICEACSEKVSLCPQCMENLALKVENRVLQMLMDNMKFFCPHKERGCDFQVFRCDLKVHTIDCEFSPMRTNFCEHIGLDCGFSTNLINLSSALTHFKRDHHFVVTDELVCKLELETHFSFTNFSIWNPVLINVAKPLERNKGIFSAYAVIVCAYHPADQTLSLVCFSLTESAKFHTEFHIKSASLKIPDISWRTPALDVLKADIYMPKSLFRIPTSLLMQHYKLKDQSKINVQVKLIPMGARIPKDIVFIAAPTIALSNLDFRKDLHPTRSNEAEDFDESKVLKEAEHSSSEETYY